MKQFWQSYKSKLHKDNKANVLNEISISNDEVALLAKRLEFFLPEFHRAIPAKTRLVFIIAWSLFSSSLLVPEVITDFNSFLSNVIRQFVLLVLTVWPIYATLDVFRGFFKKLPVWQVCLRVLLITAGFSVISMTVVSIVWHLAKSETILLSHVAFDVLNHIVSSCIIAIFILLFYLTRYRELSLLLQSFELKLAAQNEIFNARMSPHFFFNTLNGLVALVESDSDKATQMLGNISTLFRASFEDTPEISFDEEIDLCKVFLAIDEMRFHGKLDVTWNLPDEDLMYDMVITSLTLQSVLEKVLHHVVEMTTETIQVNISAIWENHRVEITIDAILPTKTLLVRHDLNHQMDFDIQAERLKYYFGSESKITTNIKNHSIKVVISYPLHDPSVSFTTFDSTMYAPVLGQEFD